MIAKDCNEAWTKMVEIVVESGAAKEFYEAARASAEVAGRAMGATYGDERVHALMCARQEFYYELADRIRGAQETSESQAKELEAERIRHELDSL